MWRSHSHTGYLLFVETFFKHPFWSDSSCVLAFYCLIWPLLHKKVKCQNISNILRLESCVHFFKPFLASIPKMKNDINIVSIAAFIFSYISLCGIIFYYHNHQSPILMVICLHCQCLRCHSEPQSSECSLTERFIVTELTRAWTLTPGDRHKFGYNRTEARLKSQQIKSFSK